MNETVRNSIRSLNFTLLIVGVVLVSPLGNAGAESVYGPELQGFVYPYELNSYFFESQGTHLKMGYMDTPASGKPNGRTVVLMHGKFLWCHLGRQHQGIESGRIPCRDAGSNRILQLDQA